MKQLICTGLLGVGIALTWPFQVQAEALQSAPAAVPLAEVQSATSAQGSGKLVAVLRALDRYQADFTQMSLDAQGNLLQESSGQVHMAKPQQFEWRIQTPYHQRLVVQGQKLWIVDDDLEQVTVQALSAEVGTTPAMLLSASPGELAAEYAIEHDALPKGAERFTLVPKVHNENSVFERMSLVFRKGLLMEMDFSDSLGQRTAINFTKAQMNKDFDAAVFSVKVPEGYDLIEDV